MVNFPNTFGVELFGGAKRKKKPSRTTLNHGFHQFPLLPLKPNRNTTVVRHSPGLLVATRINGTNSEKLVGFELLLW